MPNRQLIDIQIDFIFDSGFLYGGKYHYRLIKGDLGRNDWKSVGNSIEGVT